MIEMITHVKRIMLVSITILLFLSNLNAAAQGTTDCSPTETSGKGFTVFISDLHMGIGKYPNSEKWNEMEDFRWEKEFGLFLDEINRIGNGKTDLVINGDLFELWQFVEDNCNYGNPNLGCTEKDALKRIQNVLKSHESEFQLLRKFVEGPGQNRLHIVPGNHDAALLYGAVAKEVLKSINATPGKVCILPKGYWRSTDGLVYAEHGHQIEGDTNSYKNKWPKPFTQYKGKTYLIRTLGERFVQKYYNPFENKYPIIDNLSEEKMGLKYGFAAEGWLVASTKDLPTFANFAILQISADQFASGLLGPGETGMPNYDVKIIKKNWDEKFISDLLPIMETLLPEDSIDRIVLKKIAEKNLSIKPSNLSDDQIIIYCKVRSDLIARLEEQKQTISISECPVKTGTLSLYYMTKQNDEVLKTHIMKSYKALPSEGNIKPPEFKVFIYSHTHKAHDDDKYTIELSSGSWAPKVFNSGAWIRVIDKDQLEELRGEKNIKKDKYILTDIALEELPSCYSFVMIEPYENEPNAKLRYWASGSNNSWKISTKCKADN